MPNLFLTDKCGRGCKFCFAQVGPWSDDYPRRALSFDEVTEIFQAWAAGQPRPLGLVGGEPLIYPRLLDVVNEMGRREIFTKIFTSGTCAFPEGLAEVPRTGGLNFVVNIAAWDTYPADQQNRLGEFLRTFGPLCSLSYTMVDPDRDPAFLLDYIAEYHLRHNIRMGVALPIVGLSQNEHLGQELYRAAGARFVEFAGQASRRNVVIGTDCGFVACMFEVSEIGRLLSQGMQLQFECGPAMDIGPDLEIWHCFPLSRMPRVSLREFKNLDRAKSALSSMADQLRERLGPGIFKRCRGCKYRARGQCKGGCLGLIVPSEDEMKGVSPILDPKPSAGAVSCPT